MSACHPYFKSQPRTAMCEMQLAKCKLHSRILSPHAPQPQPYTRASNATACMRVATATHFTLQHTRCGCPAMRKQLGGSKHGSARISRGSLPKLLCRTWSTRAADACTARGTATMQAALHVPVPPPDFDFRALTRQATHDYISKHHPGLMDLVQDGAWAVQRQSSAMPAHTSPYAVCAAAAACKQAPMWTVLT